MDVLFEQGDFTLHSGARTFWRINADALTDADLATLARLVGTVVGPFWTVEGVPRGGLRLAAALQPTAEWCQRTDPREDGVHLIVDDVLTTGGSMEQAKAAFIERHGFNRPVAGAVLFARGLVPDWIHALFVGAAK